LNYFSFSIAYLCDHLLHLFDFKCQTVWHTTAVTKAKIYIFQKTYVVTTFLKTALKHITMRLISSWQRLRGSGVDPESGPLCMGAEN